MDYVWGGIRDTLSLKKTPALVQNLRKSLSRPGSWCYDVCHTWKGRLSTMVRTYHGKQIPLEVYHGVPKGWYARDILAEHARLGGTYDLRGPDATELGAPGWLPERYEWLQYRLMLYRIADGVRADDPACVELAVRYILLRYIGSYSGHARSLLSRRLKHATLTPMQKERLRRHFLSLVIAGDRSHEFGAYLKLWRVIETHRSLEDLLRELESTVDGKAKAQWLAERLGAHLTSKQSPLVSP